MVFDWYCPARKHRSSSVLSLVVTSNSTGFAALGRSTVSDLCFLSSSCKLLHRKSIWLVRKPAGLADSAENLPAGRGEQGECLKGTKPTDSDREGSLLCAYRASCRTLVRARRMQATADKLDVGCNSPYRLLEPDTLTVSVYANFFPVAYRQGDRFEGLEVELMKEFSRLNGLRVHFRESREFDGVWSLPAKRVSDVAIGGITVAESRCGPETDWSEAYFSVRRTLLFNKRAPVSSFPDGISGIIHGTPGSTGYLDAEARLVRVGKRVLLHDSTDEEEDLQLLLSGKIQGLVRGSVVGKALVERYPNDLGMMDAWEILPELRPTERGEVFMLPTRAGSGLAAALTAFLNLKAADGSLQGLLQKYRLL